MADPIHQLDAPLRKATSLIERRLDPLAILLFGSAAAGRLTSDSDVDIAVLLGSGVPDPFALATLRTDLEAVLEREVDLVILDTASPILCMEVLRHHRILANRHPEEWQRFVVRTSGAYFDLKRVRRPIEEALLQRAAAHE